MILLAMWALFPLTNGVAYLNTYDGLLNFKCPSGTQAIVSVTSHHDNHYEDRRFALGCAEVSPDHHAGEKDSCFWTDYENAWDQLLHFSCPTNNYISGMYSVHDNDHEDRKWKFYCCSLPVNIHTGDCYLTGWTNDFDHDQHFTTLKGEVIKGVISIHDNTREDRRYEYEVCSVLQTTEINVVG